MSADPIGVKPETKRFAVGDLVAYADSVWEIVALRVAGRGPETTLQAVDGTAEVISVLVHQLAEAAERTGDREKGRDEIQRAVLLSTLPEAEQRRVLELEGHILEYYKGCWPGREPNPDYDTSLPKGVRNQRKADEIATLHADKKLSWKISSGKLLEKRLAYFNGDKEGREGLAALYDKRLLPNPAGTLLASYSPLLIDAMRTAGREADPESGPKAFHSFEFRVRRILRQEAEASGKPMVHVPCTSTLRKLAALLAECWSLFKTGKQKRSTTAGEGPFSGRVTTRPGEVVEIDDTPIDFFLLDDRGEPFRASLLIAKCAHTGVIVAHRFCPQGGVNKDDAAMLIAQMLVPEKMRPGWKDTLRAKYLLVPFDRRRSLAERYDDAAARPVIFPEAIQVDRASEWLSEYVARVSARVGMDLLPARPRTGPDKPNVEGTHATVGSRFCAYVNSYTGRNPAEKGANVEGHAYLTVPQADDLFAEWMIVDHLYRKVEGCRHPLFPGLDLSPAELYGISVGQAGYVECPLGPTAYMSLLPFEWRTADRHGFKHEGRRYVQKEAMRVFLEKPGPREGFPREWPVHYDRNDPTHVYVYNYHDYEWVGLPWRYARIAGGPFTEYGLREAERQLLAKGREPTEKDLAEMLYQLRDRLDLMGDDLKAAQRQKMRMRTAAKDAAAAPRLQPDPVEDGADDDGEFDDSAVITVPGGNLSVYRANGLGGSFDRATLRSYGDPEDGSDDEEDY